MNSRIVTVEQGSPEWLAIRAGKVTSAGISKVLAKPKRGNDELEVRKNYKKQILSEILSGRSFDLAYKSRAMKEGSEAEPFARAAYEIQKDVMVDQVGFVLHPTIERAGCSPDGFVGDSGIIEIKAPEVTTHIEYLLGGTIPPEYIPQCVWMLACNPEREWLDFVSYDKTDSLPEHLRLFVCRMECAPDVIEGQETAVRQFLHEVNGLLIQLESVEKVLA